MSYGRRKIFTDETEITAENVVREVNVAYLAHLQNRNEISKLYRYYRNKTAIEDKTKEIRENINFKHCRQETFFRVGTTAFMQFPSFTVMGLHSDIHLSLPVVEM